MNSSGHSRIHFFQLLLLALLAVMPAQAAFTVLDYWRMGENDPGAISGRSCTNLIDVIGGRTLTNTPVYPTYTNDISRTAVTNTGSLFALQMNGGQSATGNVISGLTDNFGIELWVKPANTSGSKIIAYNGNTSSSGWGIYQSGLSYQGLFGGQGFIGLASASANVWTHLALVRASGTTTLYVNGVSAGTSPTTPNTPVGDFLIGANNAHVENFAGAIDEVRVFNFGAGEFNVTNLLYFQKPVFTLSTTNFSVGASAGTNNFDLSVTPTNVSWSATPNVGWLHVTNTSGTGNANIRFTFDDNPGAARVGTLTSGDQTVTVSQGAPSYSLNGNYDFYWTGDLIEEPSGAGSDGIGLTVTPNVGTWSVSSFASWIHPTNPSGAGSATIGFTFDANTDPAGAARFGQVFVNNPAGTFLRFVVFQQAPSNGTSQVTYRYTGRLLPYLPQYIPADASAALKSVQSGDVFYLTMTLVPSPSYIYFGTWGCAVNGITFSVPSRGLVYTKSFNDLEVLADNNNPHTLRWDVNGVDSTVTMIFWARDFSHTALASGNVPYPMDLSGFHADGFAQIILFNNVGGNPTLFYGELVPMIDFNLRQKQNTNTVTWVNANTYYHPTLQTTFALGTNVAWTNITNAPVNLGIFTNIVTLPATNRGAQFFRLHLP